MTKLTNAWNISDLIKKTFLTVVGHEISGDCPQPKRKRNFISFYIIYRLFLFHKAIFFINLELYGKVIYKEFVRQNKKSRFLLLVII